MKLIVGLGNPGKEYAKSKHNIGFMIIDAFAQLHQLKFKKDTKFQGEWVRLDDTILLKPKTYMNLSGQSVSAVCNFFQIKPEDVLVISDDLDLPFGKIRLREKGSAGGHNGLKSIISHIGNTFKRFRIGIDRDDEHDVKDYVLSRLSKEQQKHMNDIFILSNQILDAFNQGVCFDGIMNDFNPKKES